MERSIMINLLLPHDSFFWYHNVINILPEQPDKSRIPGINGFFNCYTVNYKQL